MSLHYKVNRHGGIFQRRWMSLKEEEEIKKIIINGEAV